MTASTHRLQKKQMSAVDIDTGSVWVDESSVAWLVPATSPGALPTKRDLLLQALLHLPRIASRMGAVTSAAAMDEIRWLHANRIVELSQLRTLTEPPARPPALRDLAVRVLDASEAAPILEHFHYLRSARRESICVGAVYQGRVAALCCISPFDLPSLAERLPTRSTAEAAVVSRVFAFDWAPRNVISYLLSRVETTPEVVHDEVRLLITYVNPNMGFTGASLRAANWLPLGSESGTRYAYLDRRYITDRAVARLAPRDRAAVTYSTMPLRPLRLLCRPLDKRLRRAYPTGFDFAIQRRAAAS